MADHNLSGSSILITGGASGIGLAAAKHLATHGAHITIADVQDDIGQQTVEELTAAGYHAQFVHCNVKDWASQVSAFKATIRFSPSHTLDAVICSAGIYERAPLVEMALAQPPSLEKDPSPAVISAIEINLIGEYYTAWLACHYFPYNAPSSSSLEGRASSKLLVMIASYAAYTGPSNSSTTYWASKWGVRGMFQSIKHNAKRAGARVNLLAPHFVKTPMVKFNSVYAGWTDMEDVVQAISNCVMDENIDGRSLGVFPRPIGIVDMQDDRDGAFAGLELQRVVAQLAELEVARK